MLMTITDRRIGEFRLDATTSERHSSTLTITDNPVESGSVISDHAVAQPKTITITGVIVGYEPSSSIFSLPTNSPIVDCAERLKNRLPFKIDPDLPELRARRDRVLEQYKSINAQIKSSYSLFAPFLPSFKSAIAGTGSDRVAQYHDMLLKMQNSGVLLEIMTGTRLYKNMLLESVEVDQTIDGSAEFTITAREVFIAETIKGKYQRTSPLGKNPAGVAGVQSAKPTYETQPPKPVSGLRKTYDSLVGGKK